jgi:hypothetical protein
LKYGPIEKMEIGGTIGHLWNDVHEGGIWMVGRTCSPI